MSMWLCAIVLVDFFTACCNIHISGMQALHINTVPSIWFTSGWSTSVKSG